MSIITVVVILIICLLIFSIFIDAVAATPVLNVAAGLLLVILTGFYMLPTAIHIMRGLPDASGKFWINFLLGWTVIVWIWGLVTACITESKKVKKG
ncbi:MAG: superinfection immunity protein [Endomicrobium sp.]|jgi:hypothetical protein|nr:superinfection immunity protein [Endomicrobium sp.]